MKQIYFTSVFLLTVVIVSTAIAFGETGSNLVLANCQLLPFDSSSCQSDVADMERRYPSYSIPRNEVELLAEAYRNLALATPSRASKDIWEQKGLALFEFFSKRASTATDWYLVSKIAIDRNTREASLRNAVALDPVYFVARQELLELDLDNNNLKDATTEWTILRASPTFQWANDWQNAFRLANEIAGSQQVEAGRAIVMDALNGTANMPSYNRCYMFGWVRLDMMKLDEHSMEELKAIRTVCTATKHRAKGMVALNRGDKRLAIAEFEAQIREDPGYADPYALLEGALRSSGKLDAAFQVIKTLFNSSIQHNDKCDAMARIPLEIYSTRDPQTVAQIRMLCGAH
jgi:hypothetical protein